MYAFQDKTLSAAERADALLKELTDEEKASLLTMENPAIPRLGIPAYHWWNEALHGVARNGKATMFPQAIAIAATFTPELTYKMARIIAKEARIKHFHYAAHGNRLIYSGLTMYSPNINIFRDPRWGRGHETYGECPVLTAQMGDAFVRGLQGNDPEHIDCAATVKHFAVHSGPEGDRAHFNAMASPRDLVETYYYAFRHCLETSKSACVMTAYNALNGTPMSENTTVLNDVLRHEWGFQGVVVTDVGTANNLKKEHKTQPDMEHALASEINSGVDVCCEFANALEAYRQGLIHKEDMDRAVRNQLILKFKLGLFDTPEILPDYSRLECAEHRAVSRAIAERSVVLLKNDGILPLDPSKPPKIAVIGPLADDIMALKGNYYGTSTRYVTLLEGIIHAIGEDNVLYAKGSEIMRDYHESCSPVDTNYAEVRIAAENSDIVILCLGLNSNYEGEIGDASNAQASGDKTTLELPESQLRLLEVVHATGKPIILLNVSGSAMVIPEASVNAAVQVFYPGPMGGDVVADILFGKVNPSGRLPLTFYRSTADLPDFRDYSMENRTYRFFKGTPQYPFGYGLSYTTFEYSELQVPEKTNLTQNVPCSVHVRNTGKYAGETTVLFFFRYEDAPCRTPLKQFAGSVRLLLKPGEENIVSFDIPAELLRISDDNGVFHTLPGRVTVITGDLQKTFIRC